MAIDKLVERTTIEFPEPQTRAGVKRLFAYLSEHMPCGIRYASTIFEYVESGLAFKEAPEDPVVEGMRSIQLEGSINPEGRFGTSFHCMTDRDTFCMLTGMKFNTIPGYSLAEHREDEVAVWDLTRKLVEEYFSENR